MASYFWERRREGEPTPTYLGRVLDELGFPDMARRAREGHFDDYFAPPEVADGMEILRLYNFSDHPSHERQIQGITSVNSRPALTQVTSEEGVSFVRGRRIEIEFDEEQFAGGGAYLFASLLERFLGLYVSMNSFTILAARTSQRKEPFRAWPPRTGNRVLV